MSQKHESEGFSLIEALIVVLIVAVLAVGGWYVWHKNKKQDTNKPAGQTSQQQNKQDQKPADPSEGGKYLVISEWGVRFLLPEDLRGDIYYKAATDMYGGESVSFASKKLDGLVGDGICTFAPQTNGKVHGSGLEAALGRINPDNPGQFTLEYYRSERIFDKKVGDYEYYHRKDAKPGVSCTSEEHPGKTHCNSLSATSSTMHSRRWRRQARPTS